jgi:excisionase family DNA binding protein
MSLTIKEVAKISGKTEQTIYNWIKKGKIQAQKKGKIWEIEESSINNYLSGKSDKKSTENER